MKELHSLIKNEAKDFLSAELINNFIHMINPWEKNMKSYFFQITGEPGRCCLEFGCHSGPVLIDITLSDDMSNLNSIALSHMDRAELKETRESGSITVYSSGQQALFYQAVTPQSRENLVKYANHLMSITGNPAAWS